MAWSSSIRYSNPDTNDQKFLNFLWPVWWRGGGRKSAFFRNSRFPSIESNFNSTFDYREDLSRQRHPVLYREAPPRYPATPFLLYSNFLQKPFPFHILQLKKSSTLLYTQSLKRMPLSGGASLLHSSKIERKADREKVARKTRWGWGDTK